MVSKKVQLINKLAKLPCIIGDGDRITQILYSLAGNACKFTRLGHITIDGGWCEDLEHVFISVSDSGAGIPSDKFTQIFGAFEQVDMSTTRQYGGTGLGLHLVKQLVLAHNGDISVKSKVGVGSTFTVVLPIDLTGKSKEAIHVDQLSPAPSSKKAAGAGVGAGAAPGGRGLAEEIVSNKDFLFHSASKLYHHDVSPDYLILSVDDVPINQLVVENLLLPEGSYQVVQAMGGVEALEFISSHPYYPDLILLDIMMPVMSGYEVCEEIRRIYHEPIPIIMVSARDSPDDIAKGLEMGANDYVTKPFHRTEMLSRVRATLRNQQMIKSAFSSMDNSYPTRDVPHANDGLMDSQMSLNNLSGSQIPGSFS